MRIRQIKPSFWSDSKIADLPVPTRLFFIGTWGLADDAGFINLDIREMAKELYGFDQVKKREASVERMLAELIAAGRIVDHGCGHVEVIHLGEHQHLAGTTKQVRTAWNEHAKRCLAGPREHPRIPAGNGGDGDSREDPRKPAETRGSPHWLGQVEVSQGKERSGQVTGRASANDEEPSEFRSRVPVELALGSRKAG